MSTDGAALFAGRRANSYGAPMGTMDVGSAVARAFTHTRNALFRPMRIASWLEYGVVFFMASFVDPGLSAFHRTPNHRAFTWPHVTDWRLVATVGSIGLVVAAAVAFALAWIGCRGVMMAFRGVARGESPFSGFGEMRDPANALLRSYLVVALGTALFAAPVLVLGATHAFALHVSGVADSEIARALVPYGLAAAAVAFAAMIALFFVRCFVAPILFHRRCSAREAWTRTAALARANVGAVAMFAVARFMLLFAMSLASTLTVVLTCCVGALPVIHQTLLAPLYFFDRSLTLHVIASAGGDYSDVLASPT